MRFVRRFFSRWASEIGMLAWRGQPMKWHPKRGFSVVPRRTL